MKDQIITNTVRAEVRYFMDNNNAENVFHVGYSGPVGAPDLDDLAAEFVAWLAAEWAPLAGEAWTANEIVLTDLGSLTGARKSYAISPGQAGLLAVASMPAFVTIAVKASVGHRGRGQNGRVFWIGLTEDQVILDRLVASVGPQILLALDTLNTDIAGVAPFTGLVVPHLKVAGVDMNPASSEPVLNFVLSDYVLDVQKDRQLNHKRKKKKIVGPIPA